MNWHVQSVDYEEKLWYKITKNTSKVKWTKEQSTENLQNQTPKFNTFYINFFLW